MIKKILFTFSLVSIIALIFYVALEIIYPSIKKYSEPKLRRFTINKDNLNKVRTSEKLPDLIQSEGVDVKEFSPGIEQRINWNDLFDTIAGKQLLRANSRTLHQLVNLNQEQYIYNVVYTIDQNRRRVISKKEDGNIGLHIFGGSFAFGFGLKDKETFDYRVEVKNKNIKTQNYSYPGGAPSITLDSLKRFNFSTKNFKKNIGIYTYVDLHIERVVGDSDYHRYLPTVPCYDLVDGKVVHMGTFENHSLHNLYRMYENTSFARTSKLNLPFWFNQKHLDLSCAVIDQIGIELINNYKFDEFYVLFHPLYFKNKSYTQKIYECLLNKGVGIIDLRNIIKDSEIPKYQFPYDKHPRANLVDLMSIKVVERITN